MSSKTPYSNPYDLSDDMENQIQNVEVADSSLRRGSTIDPNIQRKSPWANPYDLPREVDYEIRSTVAEDPGVHRGTTYSAQGDDDDIERPSGADPFRTFGRKASKVIWGQVMSLPTYARRSAMRAILDKLSPELWITVDQASTREQAQGRNAQDALRIGLENALSQQMVQDLMTSGSKFRAVGLAGLGACCAGCSGREGLGWSISGGISSGISAIGSGASAVASATKEVAELACSAVNSPLARPAANYGGYAQGGTAGSYGATKGLETAQKVCGGAKPKPVVKVTQKPIAMQTNAPGPALAKKLPLVPILAVGGLIAFFAFRK